MENNNPNMAMSRCFSGNMGMNFFSMKRGKKVTAGTPNTSRNPHEEMRGMKYSMIFGSSFTSTWNVDKTINPMISSTTQEAIINRPTGVSYIPPLPRALAATPELVGANEAPTAMAPLIPKPDLVA
mmetsp:Transcript_9112/g.10551  ORF Transcript_9112/g.10551 Transcript_9112/m.10551 type:complete len:126 (-) Transcript_9112:447-824(-)